MSQPMDSFLAEYYGTSRPSVPQEEQEKQATVELFLKIAKDQKIDLNSLGDDKVQELYTNFIANVEREKTAAAQPGAGGATAAPAAAVSTQADLVKAAQAELAEKQAAQMKTAEFDWLGRVAAHAMVNELRKIAAAEQAGGTPAAPAAPAAGTKTAEMPEAFRKALEAKKGGDGKEEKSKEEPKDEKKEAASALDALAADHAVKMAGEAQFDVKEAAARINAVLTLGLCAPSTKIAADTSLEGAVEIRALELLEVAKYPVTWK